VARVGIVLTRPALLVLAVAAVAVAGCGSGSSGAGAGPLPTPSPTVTPTQPSSPPVTVTASPTKTKTVTASPTKSPPHLSACGSSQLTLTLGQGQGAAGSFYTPIILTNKGSKPCTMLGYPGVSYISTSGAAVGQPASEIQGKEHTVTLQPGGAGSALLHQPNPLVFPPADCHKKKASGLRVYPPGQTLSLTVATSTPVCTTTKGRSGVTPMQPGTNPTL
jgi:hypothetical protein